MQLCTTRQTGAAGKGGVCSLAGYAYLYRSVPVLSTLWYIVVQQWQNRRRPGETRLWKCQGRGGAVVDLGGREGVCGHYFYIGKKTHPYSKAKHTTMVLLWHDHVVNSTQNINCYWSHINHNYIHVHDTPIDCIPIDWSRLHLGFSPWEEACFHLLIF